MRDILVVTFILSIPFLAVFGHDVYLAYTNTELEGVDRFYPSDLGWLWVQYSPESYNAAVESIDVGTWEALFAPILQQSAIMIAASPALLFLGIMLLMKIFGAGRFRGEGLFEPSMSSGGKKSFSFSNSQAKRAKYKRK